MHYSFQTLKFNLNIVIIPVSMYYSASSPVAYVYCWPKDWVLNQNGGQLFAFDKVYGIFSQLSSMMEELPYPF